LIDTGSRVLVFDTRLAKTLPLTIHSRRYNQVVYFTAVSELAGPGTSTASSGRDFSASS
jgi:hypothetical protein